MPRRQRLPLQLQSSSISRGRQIKLLTQYPLYPYNKNKYDRSSWTIESCYDFQVPSLSLFFRLLHALCNFEGGKKIAETVDALIRCPPPLLLLLLFLEHGCLRADLNFSRNRNEEEMFVIGIIISLKFTLDIFTYNFLLFSCPVYLCK